MDAAIERERTVFDQAAAPFEDRLALCGAGGFGRHILAGLRQAGIEPLAFADNNQQLWGQTEAELARDLHDILAKVQQGVEVVVEQDDRPVAVLRPLNRSGRLVSEHSNFRLPRLRTHRSRVFFFSSISCRYTRYPGH